MKDLFPLCWLLKSTCSLRHQFSSILSNLINFCISSSFNQLFQFCFIQFCLKSSHLVQLCLIQITLIQCILLFIQFSLQSQRKIPSTHFFLFGNQITQLKQVWLTLVIGFKLYNVDRPGNL